MGPANVGPTTMANDAKMFKLLFDLAAAQCKLDKPGTQPEHEDIMFIAGCIQGCVTQPIPDADVRGLFGKGAQGSVFDIGTAARKQCVLTAQQVQEGGTSVGLHELWYAGQWAMGSVPHKLRSAVVECQGLYVQKVTDVTELGVSVLQGECKEGLLVTMDMERMSCNLTEYTVNQLHILPALHQLRYGLDAAAQYWEMVGNSAAPFGTRVVKIGPIITVFKKCVTAVNALHKARLIHCDIKPDNILIRLDTNGNMEDCKFGDLGATCQAEADGTTQVAMLGTQAYWHSAKKYMKRDAAGYNAQFFDVTELVASLMEALLGLCPDSIGKLLHNNALGNLATLAQSIDDVAHDAVNNKNSQAATALQLYQHLHGLVDQQDAVQKAYGTAFWQLFWLLVRAWHSHALVYNDQHQRFELNTQRAMDCHAILSGLQAIQAGLVDQGLNPDDAQVLLDGAAFPMGPGCLDKMFSKLSPQQVLRLEQLMPGAWQQYHTSLARQCARKARARQMLLAERMGQQRMAAAHKAQAELAVPGAAMVPIAPAAACASGGMQLSSVGNSSCSRTSPVMAAADQSVSTSSCTSSTTNSSSMSVAAATGAVSHNVVKVESSTSSGNTNAAVTDDLKAPNDLTAGYTSRVTKGTVSTECGTPAVPAGQDCHDDMDSKGEVMLLGDNHSTDCTSALTSSAATDTMPADDAMLSADMTPFTQQVPCGRLHSSDLLMSASTSDSAALSGATLTTSHVTGDAAADSDMHTTPASDMQQLQPDCVSAGTGSQCLELASADSMCVQTGSQQWAIFTESDQPAVMSLDTAAADTASNWELTAEQEQLTDCMTLGFDDEPPSWSSEGMSEGMSGDSAAGYEYQQQQQGVDTRSMAGCVLRDGRAASSPGAANDCSSTIKRWSSAGILDSDMSVSVVTGSSYQPASYVSDASCGTSPQSSSWSMAGAKPQSGRSASTPGAVNHCAEVIKSWSFAGLFTRDISTTLDTCSSHESASYVSDGSCVTSPQHLSVQSPCSTDDTARESSRVWKGLMGRCKKAPVLLAVKRKLWPGVVQDSISTEPAGKTSMDCVPYSACTSDMEQPVLHHEADAFDYAQSEASTDKSAQKDKRGCAKHVRAAVKGACSAAGTKFVKALQLFICGAPPADCVIE